MYDELSISTHHTTSFSHVVDDDWPLHVKISMWGEFCESLSDKVKHK